MAWTDASKDRFKELWKNQLYSAVNIANILTKEYGQNITRNAVLGMRLRLNLPLRGISAEERAKTFTPRPRAPKSTKVFQRPPDQFFKVSRPPEPKQNDQDIPQAQRRTIFTLTSETCRWPVGEGESVFFCGAPEADFEAGRPYCPQHHARAHNRAADLKAEAAGRAA